MARNPPLDQISDSSATNMRPTLILETKVRNFLLITFSIRIGSNAGENSWNFTHISIIVSICRNDYSIKVEQFWQKFLRADSEWGYMWLETEPNQILFIVVFFWDLKVHRSHFLHPLAKSFDWKITIDERVELPPQQQTILQKINFPLIVNQPNWIEMNRIASSNNCIILCYAFTEQNWLPVVDNLLPVAHTPHIQISLIPLTANIYGKLSRFSRYSCIMKPWS